MDSERKAGRALGWLLVGAIAIAAVVLVVSGWAVVQGIGRALGIF